MIEKLHMKYVLTLVILTIACLTFRPGLWLVHKPAATGNAAYARGWEDGCISGTNSYSLLYPPFLERPFVKQLDEGTEPAQKSTTSPAANADKANYRTAWNEGFTLCRYYQSSVYELMQFAIIVTTLFFIGWMLKKKN